MVIPLSLTWRGEFSGALRLTAAGCGFEKFKPIDVPLNAPTLDVVLDLATLQMPPGEYVFALYGGLVNKYRYNVAAIDTASQEVKLANDEVEALTAASHATSNATSSGNSDGPAVGDQPVKQLSEKLRQAEARKAAANERLKEANKVAAPREIVDIVVSEPIHLHVIKSAAH